MPVYQLEGVRINDSWYCKEGDTYHSFFLEYGEDQPKEYMWEKQVCGHMMSKDLIHWEYAGNALKAEAGTWNDLGIATGSVAKYNGRWYMMFTANSVMADNCGIGVAVSDELITWEKLGEGPVIRRNQYYPFTYEGKTVMCQPLADPYVYPEPIDGYYFIYINSYAVDFPVNNRGTTAIFKTKDFIAFTPHKIAVMDICDRMETVQVWKHNEKYYMYAGIVMSQIDENDKTQIIGQSSQTNYLFTADQIDGPYRRLQVLAFPAQPDYPGFLYIAKVLKDPDGKDVIMINNVPYGVVGPYAVEYCTDDTIKIIS